MTVSIGTLLWSGSKPDRALLLWNATASAPLGLYRVQTDHQPALGELVLVVPSRSVAAFAASRGYLPMGIPLVKRIAALASDTICARENVIFINSKPAASRLLSDHQGRVLPGWSRCRVLGRDEVFLLMPDVRDSFDGRYFGPVHSGQIVGRLVPLWTY